MKLSSHPNRREWLTQLSTRREWLAQFSVALWSPFFAGAPAPQKAEATYSTTLPPKWREFVFSGLSGFRTPTADFFLRSHLNYPRLKAPDWELVIDGLVKHPAKLRFSQLSEFPSTLRTVTFECAGNPPGGGLVSTAEWRGVSLQRVLENAGLPATAREIVLEGSDFGLDEAESVPLIYSRSIPLDKALSAETMIAWEMNGDPLPWEHGFPARLIVPGYYAMSHVKWLSRIRVIDRAYRGFYMKKRYFTARPIAGTREFEIHPEMQMKLKSQIARPVTGEQLSSPTVIITGAAWTGEGKVARVEVSTDGGITWRAAELFDNAIPYAWVRWKFLWNTPANGAYQLVCRAFDDRGEAQPESPDPKVINRYGNNWYHRVEVTVRRS